MLVILAILTCLQVSANSGSKNQIKIAQCSGNIRQIALATQVYASESQDKLPTLTGSAAWAWDLPDPVAQVLLRSGCTKRTFYCPGTEPSFTDKENFLDPYPSSLWTFASPTDSPTSFHIIGYALAFNGSASRLNLAEQNSTMLPERVNSVLIAPAKRVLVADVIISSAFSYPATPNNNFTSISGGFYKPHTSSHVVGQMPIGNNLAFKDGHVEWKTFNSPPAGGGNPDPNQYTIVRTASGPYFWW